jgi:hypothetical protein
MHAMKQIIAVILTIALPAIAFGQSDDPELAAIPQRVRER